MISAKKEYWVGLSGGVDSAVAALLLKERGASVRAFFMKNWEDDDTDSECSDKADMLAAAAAADVLGLDFDVINFAAAYRAQVFEPFLRALEAGDTPNPDIWCNAQIKFLQFAQAAFDAGAGAIATGHYAKIDHLDGRWRLKKGEDAAKDQSYFLYRLTQSQLERAVFPLAALHKSEVRAKARAAGLANWSRPDSTGICFIGERRFAPFIARYIKKTPGEIRDENDVVVGEHQGLAFYTIGQRRGLNIGGRGDGWFVAAKEARQNILRVVQGGSHPLLFSPVARLADVHWISGAPPPPNLVYTLRLRHRHEPASCTLSESTATAATAIFAEPQRAVTPGQHAVLYDGNICLGGGVICA